MNFAFGRRKFNRRIKPLCMQQVFLNGVHLWLNIKNKTRDPCICIKYISARILFKCGVFLYYL